MAGKNISMAVIRRLPKYYRYLGDLLDNDVQRISSKELSEIIGFTSIHPGDIVFTRIP